MYQLDEKIYFYVLVLIPVLLLLYLGFKFWQKRTQKKFANPILLDKLSPNKSTFKSVVKLVLVLLAIACLAIALVNPKIGTKLETVKREGVDIVFAIDVSKSMAAEDIAPNRLEKAKRIVSEIINHLASDRIGIIAYAGQAHPQLPITTDYSAAKMFLQSMNTDMMSSQGTAINEAIDLATTYYDDQDQTNRVLFLVSDGEDHSDMAVESVEKATKAGIKIYTIGVGTTKGGPIPVRINGIIDSYKKDNSGEVVVTRLNEGILTDIAQEGNGEYINGSNTEKVVDFVTETLTKMDKTEFESKQYADFKDQFQWFIAGAILFLFIDVFMLERKTVWIQKLNLFNEKKEDEN
ncbi:VWA domain-containing protein [Galbibacter pacificus]|uniref:VWA domain-containing protein n=1 Tax=Galbibacter pacificus TaxID=2996052 RepID=A0ABT6FU83_9FLAO|nr:VWA domain-containing protein [Galbibacter pacificus]MDG3583178.1 VWA domain-containing protein [Galbibacter pacificus]MDG3586659.1 VWA domain-containing protein [Galbibacter pacificus]